MFTKGDKMALGIYGVITLAGILMVRTGWKELKKIQRRGERIGAE